MRDIKFRAKIKEGHERAGEWFGWIVRASLEDALDIFPEYLDWTTCGEYIGVADSKGIEIYEGDIVQDVDDEYDNSTGKERLRVVKLTEGAFVPVSERHYSNFTVAGNIYDNPDLLN